MTAQDSARVVAAHPQHLLLTLLGDFWLGRTESLASAGLVDLLGEFGISTANARAAILRLARRDVLRSVRTGRRTSYELTPAGARILREGTQRIFSFGDSPSAWDHTWTVLAFSLPEARRDTRHQLRSRLRWMGFAPQYHAVWIAPRDRRAEVERTLRDLDISAATVIHGHLQGVGDGDPITAWDLAALRDQYVSFIEAFSSLRVRLAQGRVADDEALMTRTAVIDLWRAFPGLDPELPDELLPPDWPRSRARSVFRDIYDALGPGATSRVRAVLAPHDARSAQLASHHLSAATTPTFA